MWKTRLVGPAAVVEQVVVRVGLLVGLLHAVNLGAVLVGTLVVVVGLHDVSESEILADHRTALGPQPAS